MYQEAEKATGIVNTGKLFQTAEEICGTISTKIATVKNKESTILDNKEEIKQRWKQHYEVLYNNRNPVARAVLEELPVCNEHERMLYVMESEVEEAFKSLKKEKHLERTT